MLSADQSAGNILHPSSPFVSVSQSSPIACIQGSGKAKNK
jgi:hypothetical protein